MKLNKTLMLAALTVGGLLAISSANAQDAGTPSGAATTTNTAPPAVHRRPDIAMMLNLTDDQKAKVQPILDAQREKIRAVFQDSSLSPGDRRAKIAAIRADTTAQLKPILTPDQFAKWQKMGSRMRRMAPPPGSPTPAPATPPPAPAPAPPQQ